MNYKSQKNVILISFLFLPLLFLATFSYYPALILVYYSFTDWTGLGWAQHWVGFANYKEIFTNPEIFGVFENNAYYFMGGLFQTIAALFFAILLNGRLKGRNLFRVILFLPYILHSVATVYMFQNVFHSQHGTLNLLLQHIGLESWQQSWLGNPYLVKISLAFVSVWKYMGLSIVIFLGALQSIPDDLYEAAKIDGASAFQNFRYITLPGIRKVVELLLILTLSGALEAFEIPFVMTKGANHTTTFVMETVDVAFKYNSAGLASAMAVVLLLSVLLFIGLQNRLLNRRGEED